MAVSDVDFNRVVALARRYGATRLLLFGSARTQPEEARDLDLAVAGVPGWRLFELAARLEEALRVPLDLVSLDPPSPLTRHIEAEGEVLYDET